MWPGERWAASLLRAANGLLTNLYLNGIPAIRAPPTIRSTSRP
jgi:hypothetical protein